MDLARKTRLRLITAVITFATAVSVQECRLAAQESARIEVQIIADDMCCQGCAQKVAAQLYAAPGVSDVRADVSKRLVTITAKPSPKLTLERLWRAVEKGKGAPSKLITAQATYTLTKTEQLPAAERLAPGEYAIEFAEFATGDLQATAAHLRHKLSAQHVDVDQSRRTLIIQTARNEAISEWALLRVVKESGQAPVRLAGSFGSLMIEYAAERRGRSAAHPSLPRIRGVVR
jgi:copper chaperone CopZ